MWPSLGSNPRPPDREADALTTRPSCQSIEKWLSGNLMFQLTKVSSSVHRYTTFTCVSVLLFLFCFSCIVLSELFISFPCNFSVWCSLFIYSIFLVVFCILLPQDDRFVKLFIVNFRYLWILLAFCIMKQLHLICIDLCLEGLQSTSSPFYFQQNWLYENQYSFIHVYDYILMYFFTITLGISNFIIFILISCMILTVWNFVCLKLNKLN